MLRTKLTAEPRKAALKKVSDDLDEAEEIVRLAHAACD
jgi:hypothetical protein